MDPAQPHMDDPPGCLRTADLLGALSLAADLATGLPEEHAIRSCCMGMYIADRMQLSAEQRAALYYAELLMDVGCTAWTSHFANAAVNGALCALRRPPRRTGMTEQNDSPPAAAVLQADGATCATLTPLIRAKIRELESGTVLEVCTDDPSAHEGIAAWSRLTGNELVGVVEEGEHRRFYVRKK